MIYGFVKQSDGQLAIYSEPGHGTTVKLYLPRTEAAAERTRPETTAAVHQGQGETVLVVEDDPDVRQLAVTLLKELGYKVLEAPDGTAALAILERSPRPDLLLSDVVLSGALNGPELAREAGQLFPGIKVLFISGYAESAAHHNGLTGGHSELLNKPFHRRDLARKVRSVLDR
jgi:CheY-like chemotaxis protein